MIYSMRKMKCRIRTALAVLCSILAAQADTAASQPASFSGDAGYDSEHDMLEKGLDLSADVYKCGHHGSDSSTSYTFLHAGTVDDMAGRHLM